MPDVAAGIFDHPTAIAIGQILRIFERDGTGCERTLVRRVDIVDIEIEKRRHGIARGRLVYSGPTHELGADLDSFEERLIELLMQRG